MLDTISICLNNKSEYTGEVIKEALRIMLVCDDQLPASSSSSPPYALMRTAILSSQSFAEVKRFVLSDVMPTLVRMRVWVTAPKLWDGVIYGTKNLAVSGFKNSEHTLRALLGIPAAQLRSLLRVAPDVKIAMAKLLKTLSAEEKQEVISGKWLLGNNNNSTGISDNSNLLDSNNVDTSTVVTTVAAPIEDEAAAALIAKEDSDKAKIIKDIQSVAITSTS